MILAGAIEAGVLISWLILATDFVGLVAVIAWKVRSFRLHIRRALSAPVAAAAVALKQQAAVWRARELFTLGQNEVLQRTRYRLNFDS